MSRYKSSAGVVVTAAAPVALPKRSAWKISTPKIVAEAPKRKPSALCSTWAPARGKDPGGSATRGRCPVQLVIDRGNYAVRFCRQFNEPGRMVPVKDAREAYEVSRNLCRQWLARTGQKSLPVAAELSRRAAADIYDTVLADQPLGRARRKRRRSRRSS